MSSYKIDIIKEISEKSVEPRIGGISFLPQSIDWPANPTGEKLVLIASIPSKILNELLNIKYPADTVLSIFSTYNKKDYFLDVITYHGDEAELENIKNGYTKVILHKIGSERSEASFIIPARKIELAEKIDTEQNYTASKMGGKPGLLQNQPLNIDNNIFCIQFYSADFPEDYVDIFYLSDAVGYLFINPDSSSDNNGMFFIQAT